MTYTELSLGIVIGIILSLVVDVIKVEVKEKEVVRCNSIHSKLVDGMVKGVSSNIILTDFFHRLAYHPLFLTIRRKHIVYLKEVVSSDDQRR